MTLQWRITIFLRFCGLISWILLFCSSSVIIVLVSLKLSFLNIYFMLILWGVAFMGSLFLAQEEPIFAFNRTTHLITYFLKKHTSIIFTSWCSLVSCISFNVSSIIYAWPVSPSWEFLIFWIVNQIIFIFELYIDT